MQNSRHTVVGIGALLIIIILASIFFVATKEKSVVTDDAAVVEVLDESLDVEVVESEEVESEVEVDRSAKAEEWRFEVNEGLNVEYLEDGTMIVTNKDGSQPDPDQVLRAVKQ